MGSWDSTSEEVYVRATAARSAQPSGQSFLPVVISTKRPQWPDCACARRLCLAPPRQEKKN